MGRAWIAALVLATGCRQILGIDDPTTGEAPRVTGRALLRSTHIGADGEVVADQSVYDRADLKVSAWLDDEIFTAVSIDDEGIFSFERAADDQRYRVRVTTPYSDQEYQHTAEHLELSDRLAGRAKPNPPTSPTQIKFNANGLFGAGVPYVMSTGVWSMTPIETASPTVELDWNTVNALPRDLLRADLGDRLYFALYTAPAGASPGYLARLSTNEVTLANGAPRSFQANTVTALALDYCAHVTARRANATARLRAAAPLFANAAGITDYRIYTIPHIEASAYTQLLLAFAGSGTADADVDVHYAVPFPGQTMIGLTTVLSRTVQDPGSVEDGRTLAAIGFSAETLDPTAGCPSKQLDATAAIAGNPSIAGTTLVADSSTLALAEAPVEVTWNDAVTGQVDFYTVDVQELRTGVTVVVRRVVTTARRAVFDRDLFEPGRVYLINIATNYGQGGATTGDFDTRTSPFGTTSIVSPTFRVGT